MATRSNKTRTRIKWNPERFLANLDNTFDDKLDKTVTELEKKAKQNCPVDTGRLRNSITGRVDEKKKKAIVGSPLDYAIYVELGTRSKAPQPFLRKALKSARVKIQQLFSRP